MADDLAGSPTPPGMEEALAQPQPASIAPQSSLAGTPPPEGLEQEVYGDPVEQIKAFGEAAMRGATLGTSDLAETRLLGVDPNAIKARRNANPITSFVGSGLGGAGLVGLTGGLGGLAAGTVGEGLAAAALGGAGEGAIFGAGNLVSDYALGDPNLNAQKIMADVGIGALLGGVVGGAVGPGGVFGKKVADVADAANASSQAEEAIANAGTVKNSNLGSPSGDIDGQTSDTLIRGLNPEKGNVKDIIAAGQALGAPVTEGMTSSNRWVQQAEDALVNGAPTIAGIQRQTGFLRQHHAVQPLGHRVQIVTGCPKC